MGGTDFIAETDVSGAVVWVWRIGSRERIARPVREPDRFRHEIPQARCHGAPPEAISEWFERQRALHGR
jgi:hypothetical protein